MKKKINLVEISDFDNALISNKYNVNDENTVRGQCYSFRILLPLVCILLGLNASVYQIGTTNNHLLVERRGGGEGVMLDAFINQSKSQKVHRVYYCLFISCL